MDDSITVKVLYQRYKERLDLQWLAGREGGERLLGLDDDTDGHSIIGYLNVIHPSRIQLLGPVEFAHLDGLDVDARKRLIKQLCETQPAVLVVAESHAVPDELRECCEKSQTPLMQSSQSCSKLLTSLRHYLDNELAEKAVVHGVLLEVHGIGVLLTGESSVGKSELALELITRNHRLIADDAPEFSRVGPDTLRGRCPDMLRDFLEVRGLGVLNIRAMYGESSIKMSKALHLVVHLQQLSDIDWQRLDRLQGSYRQRTILDVDVPEVILPVASGRNLAVLVEAAVRDHILLRKGYSAAEAFRQRQREVMQSQTQNQNQQE